MKRSVLLFVSVLPLLACDSDDAVVTARAQGRMNLVMSRDANVRVVVRDGRATLSGLVTDDLMHVRAVEAARSVDGVRVVDDRLVAPTSLTGATVPR